MFLFRLSRNFDHKIYIVPVLDKYYMAKEGYTNITLDADTLTRLKKAQQQGNYKTTPETIRALLAKRDTEYKIELLMRLVDPERDEFAYLMLEVDATEEQEKAIYDLMDKTAKAIAESKEVPHSEFEKEVYIIFSNKRGDYHFAENLISILNKYGRWKSVYNHMKKSGMNI